MAIYVPGKRSRHGGSIGAKRSVVAVLQLTAMVDMFTVMVVFLLQNYATTNQVLPLSDKVDLPSAGAVKELKPSNVVVLSRDGVQLNNQFVATFEEVQKSEDEIIKSLLSKVEAVIKEGIENKQSGFQSVREAVRGEDDKAKKEEELDDFLKMTVQADKQMDFLSVKKIMHTVTEAGIVEINFAVIKRPETIKPN